MGRIEREIAQPATCASPKAADGTVAVQIASEPGEALANATLEQSLAEYSPLVRNCIRSVVGRSEDLEDLVQEVFLRLLIRMRQPGSIDVAAWLRRVSRNAAIDYMRTRHAVPVEPAQLDRGVGDGLDRHALRADVRKVLATSLLELPASQREAFLLQSFDDDRGRARAGTLRARRYGTSREAFESLVARGRRRLRSRLERHGFRDALLGTGSLGSAIGNAIKSLIAPGTATRARSNHGPAGAWSSGAKAKAMLSTVAALALGAGITAGTPFLPGHSQIGRHASNHALVAGRIGSRDPSDGYTRPEQTVALAEVRFREARGYLVASPAELSSDAVPLYTSGLSLLQQAIDDVAVLGGRSHDAFVLLMRVEQDANSVAQTIEQFVEQQREPAARTLAAILGPVVDEALITANDSSAVLRSMQVASSAQTTPSNEGEVANSSADSPAGEATPSSGSAESAQIATTSGQGATGGESQGAADQYQADTSSSPTASPSSGSTGSGGDATSNATQGAPLGVGGNGTSTQTGTPGTSTPSTPDLTKPQPTDVGPSPAPPQGGPSAVGGAQGGQQQQAPSVHEVVSSVAPSRPQSTSPQK